MKLLTLIENTSASDKLYTEHGLSFYIEHKGKKILFDMGASDLFLKNAQRMLIDLKNLDAAIISHNHIDHIGGVDNLLGLKPDIKIYAAKNVLGSYYKKAGMFRMLIGMNKDYIDKRRDNFILFGKFQQVAEGAFLMGCEVFEDDPTGGADKSLYMKSEGKIVPDDFAHEIFMVIFPTGFEEDGYVIISSCSHSGIVNILKTARRTWEDVPVLGLIAGIHLTGYPGKKLLTSFEDIEKTADAIKDMDIGPIYVCHCTGQKGYERFKLHLGDQVQYLRAGEELEF